MKNMLFFPAVAFAAAAVSCSEGGHVDLQQKVDEYAVVKLSSPLMETLSDKDKQVLNLFRAAAVVTDDLFWQQTFGDKSMMESLGDQAAKDFAMINYGPWDRLDDNAPFVDGYGDKPAGANYYPQDITPEEFAAFDDPDKNSPYTVLRRDDSGNLKCVWYKDEYRSSLDRICKYLEEAAMITENKGLKNYLLKRVQAFRTDDYYESDLAWMDMKDSNIDIVIGPVENYDDKLNELKTSYECFILLKDEERSAELAKYVSMLPELQKILPCPDQYKTFVPGTSSDLNVYDVVNYAGDCNAGSKTIAINLPNDERVHQMKGTRRLQLRNAMQAKFDKIMMPIGQLLMDSSLTEHLKFDAFFWNVTFHEVAHGLGIKETINGKGSVDAVMGTEKTSWEEAKADILGLFMVCRLIEKGEITNISVEDAITTYIAGIFRSVRFGAASSHGNANMMCFNYMGKFGAFTRNADGVYSIDFAKAKEAIDGWANLIITTQGDGNVDFAAQYRKENGNITPELQADLDRINEAGIPRDIRFIQGPEILFGENK